MSRIFTFFAMVILVSLLLVTNFPILRNYVTAQDNVIHTQIQGQPTGIITKSQSFEGKPYVMSYEVQPTKAYFPNLGANELTYYYHEGHRYVIIRLK